MQHLIIRVVVDVGAAFRSCSSYQQYVAGLFKGTVAYKLTKKRKSVCRVKRGVRYSLAENNIHFINQGIIVRIS